MCLGCWDEEGRPWNASDQARRWAPKFGEADEFGPLHIIVSDWNLEDGNIAFCRGQSPSAEEIELLDALQGMTREERWATAILADHPDFNPSTFTFA